MSEPGSWFVLLTSLSFIPILVVGVTPFLRFVIVFSAIRYGLGLQQTPPNVVLITLALFLSFFVMGELPATFYQEIILPFADGSRPLDVTVDEASGRLVAWLLPNTDPDALGRMYQISGQAMPDNAEAIDVQLVIPAFMLSELTFAFKAAFFVMVPFLLVDLAVASILMSLGIIMLPPITVSLPIKVMLFVLVDGWTLISMTVAESALT